MANTKITSEVIESGAVTSTHLASGAVTHSSLSGITTDNVTEGSSNVYHTSARARSSISVTGGNLAYDSSTGTLQLTTSTIQGAISVTDAGGDGSLAYSAGVITYTGPSAVETRAHFSGSTGVSYNSSTGVFTTSAIPNSSLTNSSITVNSNSVSLGGTVTLDTDDIGEGSTNLYYTDARVDSRLSSGSVGNIVTTGYIAGPATFTIDPAAVGDNTGTVVIAGNLQVDGTTTTINSTTMTVDDLNITLGSGAANAAAADGAGITVDGASATILYNANTNEWDFNKDIEVTGRLHTDGGEVLVNTRTGGIGWVTIEPDTATLGQIALNVIDSSSNSYASIRGNGHAFFKTIGNEATNSTNKWYTYTYTDNTYRFNYNGSGADEFIITAPTSTNRTAVYIDSENSLLAVGTTSPTNYGDTKLHLYGDGSTGILGYIYNNGSTTQSYLNFGNPDTGLTTNFNNGTGGLLVGVDSDDTSVFWNYQAAALRFGTSAVERMRIHSNGFVHIGPDSSTINISALSVKGTSSNGMLRLLPTSANAESTIGFHTTTTGTTNDFWVAGHAGWGNTGDFTIGWGTGGADLLIQQNGNVGIGTSSPSEKLHVEGSVVIDAFSMGDEEGIFFREGFSSSNKYNVSIMVKDYNGNAADGLSINGYDGISFCTGSNARNEVMRIAGGAGTNNGYVGIGTDDPIRLLHLENLAPTSAGTPDPNSMLLLDHAGDQYLEFRTSGTNIGIMQGLLFGDNGHTAFIGYKQYTSNGANGDYGESIHIGLRDFSGTDPYSGIYLGNTLANDTGEGIDDPHMFIKSGSGNVGIGTVTPEEKLHVTGQSVFEYPGNTNRGNIIIGSHGNGTNKWATLAGTHYNEATGSGNGSENAGVMIIGSHSISGSNQVWVGHGPYEINPATEIRIGTHSAATHNLGGTTHMFINSSGQVGIGSTSPSRKLVVAASNAGDADNLLLVNKNDTNGDLASIGFSMVENNTYVKGGIAFERTTTAGRGSLHFALNNSSGSGNVTYGTDDVLKLDADNKNAWFYGNVNIPGDNALYFHTDVSSAYEAKLYLSDYPSQGYNASGSGYSSSQRYWPTLASAGGSFIVVNTDGGAGASENNYDSFVIWQGAVDGDKLFKVSNGGSTSTRRLTINSAGSETTFIPNGSGLNRVDLMVRNYTSGEKHGQVIACDNNGEAHLMMVDTANSSGSGSIGSAAGGWGLDVYYDGVSNYPYNLRTGQSGTWTHREKIHFNGTREFMNSNLQHNDAGRSVQWTWFTTPAYWYSATTSSVATNFDVSSGWTNLNGNTLPTNVKAIYVTYYYHISGYGTGSAGQGDHASDHWGPVTPSSATGWSFTTSGNVQWGSAVFMHDGDASESGDMLYYGAWYPGAIIAVNANNDIYARLSHGYSGGTHYHHMYCWGYAT